MGRWSILCTKCCKWMFSPCFWFSWKVGYFCALGQQFLSFQSQHWEAVIDMAGVCMANRGQIISLLLPVSALFSPFIQVWAKDNLGEDVCCVHDLLYMRITRVREILTVSPMTGLQPCTAPLEEHRRRLLSPPRGGGWENSLVDKSVKGGTLTVLHIWKFSKK